MIKNRIISALLISSLLLMSAACGKKEQAAAPETEAINVSVQTVGTEYLENTVKYTGELKAAQTTSISAKVGARITAVHVNEGDYVKAGDVLAELDATDIQSAYNSALAGYNSALASYNSITTSATKQASTQAKNALNSAQLAYNQAIKNYDREKELYESGSALKLAEQSYNDAVAAYEREKNLYENDTTLVSARNSLTNAETALANTKALYEIGAVSKLDLDTASMTVENLRASLSSLESQKQASYERTYSAMISAEEALRTTRLNETAKLDAAKDALDNATNALNTARENIGLTEISNKSSIETANAALENARTALNTATDNLNNTKIRALSSGYIASKVATIGQMAAPGVEMFSIKNINSLIAEIQVTESVIPNIKQGTNALIDVQSAGVTGINGVVTVVNPTKNAQTGMYTVQIDINNADGKLNVGMFADVTLAVQESLNAIVVPNGAIVQEGEEYFVFTASPDGTTALKNKITIGIEADELTEVVSGINAGDRIIVSGQDYLSDENTAINIVTE